jgi:hypothetical protein
MEVPEMKEGRIYVATYQGKDGFAWIRSGKYLFTIDTDKEKETIEVSPAIAISLSSDLSPKLKSSKPCLPTQC